MAGQPMNILFVIGSLTYGGAETQAMALAKVLATRKHRVTIFSLTDRMPRLTELKNSGVDVISGGMRFDGDPHMLQSLRQCIRYKDINIVQGFLFEGDFYSRLGTLGMPIPLINSERNWNHGFPLIQHVAHRLTRFRVDGLIANTHSGQAFAKGRYNLPPDRLFTVWNGIDIEAADARAADASINYKEEFFGDRAIKLACFVGSLKWKKDVLLALDVAERLAARDVAWRVLLLGKELHGTDGKYARQVRDKHDTLHAKDNILFAGNRDDALEIIAQSDVLFSTSLVEGFPNGVLEAMTVRTPVVSTEYSDISRILNPEQVDSTRDPDEFVKRMLRVEAEGQIIADRQRRFVENHCAIEDTARAYEAIYTQALNWK